MNTALVLTATYTTEVSLNSAHLQALLLSMLSRLWVEFHVVRATKRESYTVTFKLKVVEDRAAAMEYRVKEKQVRDWRQEKDTLIRVRLILEITWNFLIFVSKKGVRLILWCGL